MSPHKFLYYNTDIDFKEYYFDIIKNNQYYLDFQLLIGYYIVDIVS